MPTYRLQFVLGTESGMITSIVRKVESMLQASGRKDVEVEIVFPVSTDAISTTAQSNSNGMPLSLPNGLTIVPGAASGMAAATISTHERVYPAHETECQYSTLVQARSSIPRTSFIARACSNCTSAKAAGASTLGRF